jgi:hypothetical protein
VRPLPKHIDVGPVHIDAALNNKQSKQSQAGRRRFVVSRRIAVMLICLSRRLPQLKETVIAINECRARRLSGELKTYVESAQCSNPRIIQAFSAAHYRRMYLIVRFTAKRLQLSEKVDGFDLLARLLVT